MNLFNLHSDNLDETLFEHRNKAYGAYELRKSYHSRVIQSFLYSLSLLAFLFGAPLLLQHYLKKKAPAIAVYSIVTVDLTKNFEIEPKKTGVSIASKPATQKASADAPFIVTKDSLITKDETIKEPLHENTPITASTNTTSVDSSDGDSTGTFVVKKGIADDPSASVTVFNSASVDLPPRFPGGESSLMLFLQKSIQYNRQAIEEQVTGKVYASFIINMKGETEAVKIMRSLGYGLDEEVVRVLMAMPLWEPGYYKGKPVSTIMNIPVSFNLVK